jgi:hypothetical protein
LQERITMRFFGFDRPWIHREVLDWYELKYKILLTLQILFKEKSSSAYVVTVITTIEQWIMVICTWSREGFWYYSDLKTLLFRKSAILYETLLHSYQIFIVYFTIFQGKKFSK